jgi:mRNA interferase RelE/StbE
VKVEFSKAFARDIRQLSDADRSLVARVVQSVLNARSLTEVPGIKKLKGAPNAFRIRVGDKRIGFYLAGDTVQFMRCLDRKQIYREFP